MTTWLLPLLGGGAVVSIFTAWLLHRRESPKAKAEAAKTIADSALKIVEKVQADNETFKRDLAAAVDYAQSLRDHIYRGSPPPPPDWPVDLKRR